MRIYSEIFSIESKLIFGIYIDSNAGIVAWMTVYVIVGDTAAPGGRLFGLVVLTVAADFGGFLISLTTLPRLIGMLITGILFQVN